MFTSLTGFRDFYPNDCAIKNYIFNIWRKIAHQYGFHEYDAPILEPLDLFTYKSGTEIIGQLFNFQDRGGRFVALRPEITPSLARLVGARASSLKKPIKWYSIGNHFRFERPQKGRLRSFYQLNLDILGEPTLAADVEIIAQAIHTMKAFGLTKKDFFLQLSDRMLWIYCLKGLKVKAIDYNSVLSIVDKMKREDRSKSIKKLNVYLGHNLNYFITIVDKLLTANTIEAIENLMNDFFKILPESEQKLLTNRINEWKYILYYLKVMKLSDYVAINLGIVRGLSYYSGFVFEIFESSGKSRAIAGGGRYDHLVKKIGGVEMPAVGYAMGDVVLKNILEKKELLPEYFNSSDVFIIFKGSEEKCIALNDIAKLRNSGINVVYSFKNISVKKQIKQAYQENAKIVIFYDFQQFSYEKIKIKNFTKNTEYLIFRKNILEIVRKEIVK